MIIYFDYRDLSGAVSSEMIALLNWLNYNLPEIFKKIVSTPIEWVRMIL